MTTNLEVGFQDWEITSLDRRVQEAIEVPQVQSMISYLMEVQDLVHLHLILTCLVEVVDVPGLPMPLIAPR